MTYMRNAGSGGQTRSTPRENEAEGAIDETVAHGVNLGYAVIEDQIRQGERLAERLRQGEGKSGATPAVEIGVLIERALNVYKDMGALALAAAETLARNPVIQSALARAWQGPAAAENAAGPGGASQFGVELSSNRRVTVMLDIRPRSEKYTPLVHALHASDPASPPLTHVRFKVGPTFAPVLHVEIDDSQPAETYSGVVVDAATNEPCGTLSVRVLP